MLEKKHWNRIPVREATQSPLIPLIKGGRGVVGGCGGQGHTHQVKELKRKALYGIIENDNYLINQELSNEYYTTNSRSYANSSTRNVDVGLCICSSQDSIVLFFRQSNCRKNKKMAN
jgi:hypothetical protein